MKDLNFQNQIKSVNVTYRVSFIGSGTVGDFTIMQVTGLPNLSTPQSFRDEKLQASFKKLSYDLQSFIAFAQSNKLQLTMSDANGANSVTLVSKWQHQSRGFASSSDSGL